jgi:cystathionine gamma-synthase
MPKKQHLKPKPGTLSVWGGEKSPYWEGATQIPVVRSVAFGYSDLDEWLRVGKGEQSGHIYSRNTNPTVAVFEEKLRLLEGAEAAVGFASGMAAVSNSLFAMLSPGDRIVSIKDSYGGTNKIFTEFLPRFNIEVVLCETDDTNAVETAIQTGCRLLYLESPTNPTIKIVDIERLGAAAKASGALVVVDNTFATPINQNPLRLGADLVIHSATKYLGGHADALGGIVCGDRALIERIYHFREINGAAMDPAAAYLLLRGMKTLHLRIRRQNRNAMKIANYLDRHPAIRSVYYPGLQTHPGHTIAAKQMKGFGGMLAFEVVGGYDSVKMVLPALAYAHRAANLGAVETIVGPPATTSHVECTAAERAAMGIPESLVRYSTGIEDADDLIADLDQALSKIAFMKYPG